LPGQRWFSNTRVILLTPQTLIVGDVTVSPSIEWSLGTVGIEFHKSVAAAEATSLYAPKPELKVGLPMTFEQAASLSRL